MLGVTGEGVVLPSRGLQVLQMQWSL
jgi:hypothetical protein